ncbi:hypothetical protein ACFO1V_02930 [Daeguia caeni]|uniref:Uncharacterized protein n=1 Tax=Daeguia caeni TaxID=439612 RepID=A0ABV9H301_9HYPH
MSNQTVSDEIYHRHAREWAAMRAAMEAKERSQAQKNEDNAYGSVKSASQQ